MDESKVDDLIARIDALAEKATKGEWESRNGSGASWASVDTNNGNICKLSRRKAVPSHGVAARSTEQMNNDAQLIAALVSAWPQIKRDREELAALFKKATGYTVEEYKQMVEEVRG